MNDLPSAVLAGACVLAFASCDNRYWVCEPGDDRVAELPAHLSATGLYADIAHRTLAPGVRTYEPEFALWSDGAEKQRFIWLPEGVQIDTSDPDDWRFPVGTRLWKQFALDGTPLETRLLVRTGAGDGPDAWVALAYVWDGDDAVASPDGAVDVRATDHDVPAAGECAGCHAGRRSHVLGFSAVQLAHVARPGDVDLAALGPLLSRPVAPPSIPGDATQRAALGYLHANCGHCHNQRRPDRAGARCFDPDNALDFTLAVDHLATVDETGAYVTAVGEVIVRGAPDRSRLVQLVSRRGFLQQMPPLATEHVDAATVALLRRWIEAM